MRNTWLFLAVVSLLYSIPAFGAAAADVAYHKLHPPIVTNTSGGPSYIRCEVQILLEDADEAEVVERHAAALRDEMMLLIAGSDGDSLATPEGKESLRQAALEGFRRILRQRTGRHAVEDLFFTAYYVR